MHCDVWIEVPYIAQVSGLHAVGTLRIKRVCGAGTEPIGVPLLAAFGGFLKNLAYFELLFVQLVSPAQRWQVLAQFSRLTSSEYEGFVQKPAAL